jgi:hypothetical protein
MGGDSEGSGCEASASEYCSRLAIAREVSSSQDEGKRRREGNTEGEHADEGADDDKD